MQGKVKYEVGNKSYVLEEGDVLWHKSTIPHRSTNIGDKKAIYFTVGVPPTFM